MIVESTNCNGTDVDEWNEFREINARVKWKYCVIKKNRGMNNGVLQNLRASRKFV